MINITQIANRPEGKILYGDGEFYYQAAPGQLYAGVTGIVKTSEGMAMKISLEAVARLIREMDEENHNAKSSVRNSDRVRVKNGA